MPSAKRNLISRATQQLRGKTAGRTAKMGSVAGGESSHTRKVWIKNRLKALQNPEVSQVREILAADKDAITRMTQSRKGMIPALKLARSDFLEARRRLLKHPDSVNISTYMRTRDKLKSLGFDYEENFK
ncbi:MAG: hypothetical protein WCW13_03190 [archaeon]